MSLNHSVLVTGATGTFGRAYLRRVLADQSWGRVIAYSRDEVKQAALLDEFPGAPALRTFLGDVRDRDRLRTAMRGVQRVVHAAALKRVDAGAYSPSESILTNVIGTMNVISAAIDAGVAEVVVISSDKAVAPTNLYGATKYCTDPSTPILMADLSWKPAFAVVRGDIVAGVDENVPSLKGWRKLRAAEVTRNVYFDGPGAIVSTSKGRIVVSDDHMFLARAGREMAQFRWVPASRLRPGMVIKHIGQPWGDQSDSWLAGIVDGEGSLSTRTGNARVTIGQNEGPVLARIAHELNRLGVTYQVSRRNKCRVVTIAAVNDILRLVGTLRPTRMIGRAEELLSGRFAPSGANRDAVVESVVFVNNTPLVGLTTTTGTLITDGYVSHNCAETYAVQANSYADHGRPRIMAVRYGNVLGSRGSVIHVWRRQLAARQPLTITHPQMSRFIMTIEEAVDLVEFAFANGHGGEVFLPSLPSANMVDLAQAVAGDEFAYLVTGLRPGGEKLAEWLLNDEEATRTRCAPPADGRYYYVLAPSQHEWTAAPAWASLHNVEPGFQYRSDVNDRWLSPATLRDMIATTEALR